MFSTTHESHAGIGGFDSTVRWGSRVLASALWTLRIMQGYQPRSIEVSDEPHVVLCRMSLVPFAAISAVNRSSRRYGHKQLTVARSPEPNKLRTTV